MGSTAKQVGQAPLTSPQQRDFINNILQQAGPQGAEAYSNILQQYDPEQFQDLFKQMFVDPAMMSYEQDVLPSIYQSFGDVNAGSSSALNQALASSAKDLSTALGSQMGQFYQQNQQNQLAALGQMGGMAGQQQYDPIVQKGYNPMGDFINAAGKIGGGYMMSTRKAKDNVRDYCKGVEALDDLSVYMYDYKPEFGGKKDQVGIIAEDLPKELTVEKDGNLMVDVYGLMGLMINSIKMLKAKVEFLEAKDANRS